MSSSVFLALALLASGKLLFAVQDVIIKEMSDGYPVHEILTVRGLVAILILLLLIHFTSGLAAIRNHRPGLHFIRGILMFLAFMSFYVALAEIPLTTNTALFFTAPFFITLLSIPLLGERVGARRVLCILAGFVGVLLVLRPNTDAFSMTALLPIAAAFFYACCQLMVRVCNMQAPPAIMSLYAGASFVILGSLTGLFLTGIFPTTNTDPGMAFLLRDWAMPRGTDLVLMLLTGVTSGLGFMFTSQAYQVEQASRVAPFEYVMIIWVTALSYLVWSEIPDTMTVIGIVIIILSGLYVLRREQDERKPEFMFR